MKAWRIILFVLLAIALAGVAVACGDDEGTTETTAAPATTAGPDTTAGTETTEAPTDTTAETTAPAEAITLVWGSGMQSISPSYTDFMVPWAAWMEEQSGGRLKFEFKVDETIMKAPEVLDGVANGVADMGDFFMGIYAGRFPMNEVLTLPFLYEYPTARAAGLTATELAKKYPVLEEEFTAAGVKLLAYWPMGPGQIHTTKKPIQTAADLKGVVMESHAGEYVAESLKLLGATPEQIPPMEGYDALAKGIVDGTIGEFEFIASAGFNTVINHSTEVGGLGQGFEALVINLDVFNDLPADLQELLTGEGAKAFTEAAGYIMDKNDLAARDALDQQYKAAGTDGVYVLPEAELEAWKTTIAPVWQMWVDKAAAAGAPAADILADAQAFAAQFDYDAYSKDYPEQLLQEWGVGQ
ncbi:MAG: TRAP transporter substrate-binding protein DctP [Thermoleophilia bacterium]|nr:TRAP transporter substrate-binding protein DctP [Thermoleophilia bacterium]